MLNKSYIKIQVANALNEDLGIFGDITSQAIIDPEQSSIGTIVLKQDAVLCGIDFAISAFKQLVKKTKILSHKIDGKFFKKGTVVLELKAKTQSILAAERSALNFLGLMSGIATKANLFSRITKPFGVKVFSTRKTIVGIRELQKYALTKGGANINRMTLDDFFFIKDNHIANTKSIIETIAHVKAFYPKKKITVEVDNFNQLKEIINEKIDVVLLDNMSATQIKKCLKFVNGKFKCEASGNINLANLKKIAQTKVDRISTGQLTHSVENIDFGLEL